jgi:plastocyanin
MEERKTQARRRAGGGASPPPRWLPLSSAAALVALAVTAAPAGGGERARVVADATVDAGDNFFSASQVTISQGESVTWRQAGSNPHNVVFDDGSFTNPAQPSASAWTTPPRQFNTPGVFRYYCALHGAPNGVGMSGTITVIVSSSPAPPPPGGAPPPPGGGSPPPGGGGSPPPGGGTQPGTQAPGTPGAGKAATTVTLKVSDTAPNRGALVRFSGTVTPAQDGRFVQLQRRTRGLFRTILRIRLTDAGSARSKFSKRVRVIGDAVFRARLPADSGHLLGTSRARRLDVP